MYGIYANIGGILVVNVPIYSIHGSYGYGYLEGLGKSWQAKSIWVILGVTQNSDDWPQKQNSLRNMDAGYASLHPPRVWIFVPRCEVRLENIWTWGVVIYTDFYSEILQIYTTFTYFYCNIYHLPIQHGDFP